MPPVSHIHQRFPTVSRIPKQTPFKLYSFVIRYYKPPGFHSLMGVFWPINKRYRIVYLVYIWSLHIVVFHNCCPSWQNHELSRGSKFAICTPGISSVPEVTAPRGFISPRIFTNQGFTLYTKTTINAGPHVSPAGLVMSNQRFFKIVCFCFSTNVPKKIEYIRFWNKIHYQNKTFSFRSQNFWSKSNWFVQFLKFSWDSKKFCLVFRNLWTKSKRFGSISKFLNYIVTFCFC